ncbi:MAG TPA: hypothetical protein VN969_25040 [Streptosporangiaceae bacterium]|nr:hypothetical protein [Streptosporangiaceae bacterium]
MTRSGTRTPAPEMEDRNAGVIFRLPRWFARVRGQHGDRDHDVARRDGLGRPRGLVLPVM